MRILILSQWFDPEPTFKGMIFAKALAARGHEVEVLTGFPNYPEGRLYPGYKMRPFQREDLDGISVIRVMLYPSHDNSVVRRILNYISFAISASLFGPLLAKRADVVYVYYSPATVALPAAVLKILRGMPIVYDIQDLWPDTLAATGMVRSRPILWLTGLMCRITYALAAKIIVLSPGFKRRLKERRVPESKIEVIYNWCDEQNIREVPRDKALAKQLGMDDCFNVVFAGTMGAVQALDVVLDAAMLLSDRNPDVQFVFVGGGIEVARLSKSARERRLQNVKFLPRRSFSEISSILALADALLVHIKDDPLFEITVPSKIQAYLAAGRPIIAALRGDGAELVQRANAGLGCDPCVPEKLAEVVLSLAHKSVEEREKMGQRGKQFYKENLALSIGVSHFEALFRSVAKTHI